MSAAAQLAKDLELILGDMWQLAERFHAFERALPPEARGFSAENCAVERAAEFFRDRQAPALGARAPGARDWQS